MESVVVVAATAAVTNCKYLAGVDLLASKYVPVEQLIPQSMGSVNLTGECCILSTESLLKCQRVLALCHC